MKERTKRGLFGIVIAWAITALIVGGSYLCVQYPDIAEKCIGWFLVLVVAALITVAGWSFGEYPSVDSCY